MELQQGEIIKPILNYEKLYSITSFGRVWTHVKCNRYNHRFYGGHFMKLSEDKDGYLRINLSKCGKKKKFYVHVIVAQTFISNPHNLTQINHKDCNKKNNNKDNLEWTTCQDNHNHATINGLRKFKKYSEFYGVSFVNRQQNKKWCAQLTIDKKHKHIGYYENEIDAAVAVNKFIIDNCMNRPLNIIYGDKKRKTSIIKGV